MKYINILFVLLAGFFVLTSAENEVKPALASLDLNPCNQPMLRGRCRALIPKFYYDSEVNECKLFKYGGCGGNDNNFKTAEECEEKCKKQEN